MEAPDYFRFLLAFIVVIGIMILISFIARRYLPMAQTTRGFNRKKRSVTVVDNQILDTKRRLVTLRHGGREKVVMLSPNNDLLLSDIAIENLPEQETLDDSSAMANTSPQS